jgi:hypothetical protein
VAALRRTDDELMASSRKLVASSYELLGDVRREQRKLPPTT